MPQLSTQPCSTVLTRSLGALEGSTTCPRALPQALRVKLPGAHELLRGLKAARVQAAEDLRRARQPCMLVQEPQCVVVHIAALHRALDLSCTRVLASAQPEARPPEPFVKLAHRVLPTLARLPCGTVFAPCSRRSTPPTSMHTYPLQARLAGVAVHMTHYGLYIAHCPGVHITVAWLV